MRTFLSALVCLLHLAGLVCGADIRDPFDPGNAIVKLSPQAAIDQSLANFRSDCPCGPECKCGVPCICGGGEAAPAGWTCGPNGCYPAMNMVAQASVPIVKPAVTAPYPAPVAPSYVCPCCGMVMATPPMATRTATVTYAAPVTYGVTTTTCTSYGDTSGAVVVGVTRDGFLGRWRARRAARLVAMGY
jgi:hypothetical protein